MKPIFYFIIHFIFSLHYRSSILIMNEKCYLLKNALKEHIYIYNANEKNIILNIYKKTMKKNLLI